MALSLPNRLADKVAGFREASYGASRVTLVLADGRRIQRVIVAWGHDIVKVGDRTVARPADLEFRIADIVDILSEVIA